MASNVSAVSGSVANGHQTLASRFHKPPCDPGRWVFPSPVLTLAFLCGPSRHVAKLKCWHTYTPPPPVCPQTRPCFEGRLTLGSVSENHPGTAKCPEPLCPMSALPPWGRHRSPPRRALPLLHRSYGLMRQTFTLPRPLVSLLPQVFADCCQPLLGQGPSRHYLCNPCVGAWTPTPRCPSGAQSRFFPENIGLTLSVTGSPHQFAPAMQLLQGKLFRGCSHFIMFRLPRLLDPKVAPTAAFQLGGRAVYTTHPSVGCLPRVVVSLRIRIGQLIRLDSHQLDYSLVGCSDAPVFMRYGFQPR